MNSTIRFFLLPILLLLPFWLSSQPLPRPGEYFSRNDTSWYNRKVGITRYLLEIIQGKPELAIAQARRQEGDVEADFIRAIAFAHLGRGDSAMLFLRRSLEKELDFGRYLASQTSLLQPLQELPEFQKLKRERNQLLVHGPMLGAVTDRSAAFWYRTEGERELALFLSTSRDFRRKIVFRSRSRADREFTALLRPQGLQPDTRYYYRLEIDGIPIGETGSFSTFPKKGTPGRFTVAFGGGAAYIPWHHHQWSTIHAQRPDALFLLGDNVYIDYPEQPQLQQYCYYRRQSEPHFRRLTASVPTFAIWDDHDFGDNDDFGTPDPNYPPWKPPVLSLFKNQWPDPGYGGPGRLPGVFFSHSIADVDFFFLDGRYYRQPSEVGATHESPVSMLGEGQKKWLKEQLLNSKASFKVIISPVPWSFDAKPEMEGRMDTWGGYREERKELFDFLAEKGIDGVMLLSADRHRSDIWRIERPNGYPLYEFESSRLTNVHTHQIMPGSIYGYNAKCSFGLLEFDTTAEEPWVEYRIVNIDNVVMHRFRLNRKELEGGKVLPIEELQKRQRSR